MGSQWAEVKGYSHRISTQGVFFIGGESLKTHSREHQAQVHSGPDGSRDGQAGGWSS
jgi:hypothetical protein